MNRIGKQNRMNDSCDIVDVMYHIVNRRYYQNG